MSIKEANKLRTIRTLPDGRELRAHPAGRHLAVVVDRSRGTVREVVASMVKGVRA